MKTKELKAMSRELNKFYIALHTLKIEAKTRRKKEAIADLQSDVYAVMQDVWKDIVRQEHSQPWWGFLKGRAAIGVFIGGLIVVILIAMFIGRVIR